MGSFFLFETSFLAIFGPKYHFETKIVTFSIFETLLLVILGQILALKPPKTARWFQKNCQKRSGFNETAGWFQ